MNRFATQSIRTPVKRQSAQSYLLLMLMSFALSIILTRLFLTLTGFPRVGGGNFHIAHVLWGGLLLFVGGLLPLMFVNRWVYPIAAILSGIGVGLFIDEVGKFITSNNDYFSPLAAPIIYAFFLITVLVYLRAKVSPSPDTRAEFYYVFDQLQEMLDHDLEPHERQELLIRLDCIVKQAKQPDLGQLAKVLYDFLSGDTYLAPDTPTLWERVRRWTEAMERRFIGPRRLKMFLISGLGVFAFVALIEPVLTLLAVLLPGALDQIAAELIVEGQVTGVASFQWYFVRLALEGIIGVILVASSVLLVIGKDQRGIELGYFGLLFSLTTVNLLTFYFNQFGNIVLALVEFWLLLAVIYYRRHYLPHKSPQLMSESILE